MATIVNSVGQTSKTILFEEFKKEDAPSLYLLLKKYDIENDKDELFMQIDNQLGVKNFDQFKEKFMPRIWEYTKGTCLNDFEVHYTLEEPPKGSFAHELKFNQTEFYKMALELYNSKKFSGKSNLEFDYTRVEELLSPKKFLENAKKKRIELESLYKEQDSLSITQKYELNRCNAAINNIRKEIAQQYQNSISGQIKLMLADTTRRIENSGINEDKNIDDNKALPFCRPVLDDNGEWNFEPIVIEDNSTEMLALENKNEEIALKIEQRIEADYNLVAKEKNSFMKDIVLSNYTSRHNSLVTYTPKELKERNNLLVGLYNGIQEEFSKTIFSAIEKIINVKAFFDHASEEGRDLKTSLIITNCKADDLLDDSVRDDFSQLLCELSKETLNGRKLWFAILPAIGDEQFADNLLSNVVVDDDSIFDTPPNNPFPKKNRIGDLIDENSMLQMLDILKKSQITTFFNYKGSEKTGFKMKKDIMISYRQKLVSLEQNPYAVFCYPNFSILPYRNSTIKTGIFYEDSGKKVDQIIDIPGIYLDSSYIAAGLTVGSQDVDYLKYRELNVLSGNACVRFDIEDKENYYSLSTYMNMENSSLLSDSINKLIEDEKFGFCFSSDVFKDKNNQNFKHAYVKFARSMCKDSKSNQFIPVFAYLTLDYLHQFLIVENRKSPTAPITQDTLDYFKNKVVSTWKNDSESEEAKKANFVNLILKPRDEIDLKTDSLILQVNDFTLERKIN